MNVCGERIRALRESMNYSQMKFAQIFDLGQSSVVRYEKGEAAPANPVRHITTMPARMPRSICAKRRSLLRSESKIWPLRHVGRC